MVHKIQNDQLTVEANELGAELWSFFDRAGKTQHLWQGDPAVWELRSPTIFPYCGRIKDFYFVDDDGTRYEGINHGFSRTSTHQLLEKSAESLVFRLEWSEETRKLYPYRFRLDTTYRLEGNRLHWRYTVTNLDTRDMPYNVGFHPGFICPFGAGRSTEDYALVFQQKETPTQLLSDPEGQLLTGETTTYFVEDDTIPLADDMFPKNICLTDLRSQYIDILEKPTGRFIRLSLAGFPNVVFWSKPGKLHFICVEPWTGRPDTMDSDHHLAHKQDIQILRPGETSHSELTIEIGQRAEVPECSG